MSRSAEDIIWEQYNGLVLGPDIERMRKLLVRYDLFRETLELPGDIVECGVFKGTCAMYWAKLLQIYAPASPKKVIGFDTFSDFADSLLDYERDSAREFTDEAAFEGTSPEHILGLAKAADLRDRLELVAGDVLETAIKFVEENPGFRISLLHLDLDAYAGTKAVLEAFYDRIVTGGIIVCDQYGGHKWGESDAVDEFLRDRGVPVKAIPHSRAPTAYFVKPA